MRELLVAWELATDDHGYFGRFYPAVRIAEACANRGVTPRFLFARDIPSPGKGTNPEPQGISPLPDRCLIRGMTAPPLIKFLEDRGVLCVNSSASTALANDKLETARTASRLGIPTPRVWDPRDLGAAPWDLPFPLVVKPRYGSRGRGVTLAENGAEAHALARENAPSVFQEYVASSRGRDLRVFFAGDRIIAVAERRNSGGALVSNAAGGGRMKEAKLPEPEEFWREAALEIAREAGLRYGSVDWLYDGAGGLTLCEINAAPGFEELEKACAVDAAGAVVDAVLD